jgi:hypothetical protein
MWPFDRKNPIRYESPELLAFEAALSAVRRVINDLEAGEHVPDETIRSVYFTVEKNMQSNCDAVASGLLATIGSICAHAKHMAPEFLPSAMQPIYYLGIEDTDGINAYILHVADVETTYPNTETQAGRKYVKQIAEDRPLLRRFARCTTMRTTTGETKTPAFPVRRRC